MLLCGYDCETTGLDLENDRIIEVGLVHWDTEARQPVRMTGFFIKPDIEIPDTKWDEIRPINGITKEMVETYGFAAHAVLPQVQSWFHRADAICTHNGLLFDRPLYENWLKRDQTAAPDNKEHLWIDTRIDLPEPMQGTLTCLAAKRGFLNPFPHRAVTDVLTMLKILDSYDLTAAIDRAKIPSVTVVASVPFARKDEARNRGYYWRANDKTWAKRIKECDLDEERNKATFPIMIEVEPDTKQEEVSWV